MEILLNQLGIFFVAIFMVTILLVYVLLMKLSVYFYNKFNIKDQVKFESGPIMKPVDSSKRLFIFLKLFILFFVAILLIILASALLVSLGLYSLSWGINHFFYGMIIVPFVVLALRPLVNSLNYYYSRNSKLKEKLKFSMDYLWKQSAIAFVTNALFCVFVFLYDFNFFWLGGAIGCLVVAKAHFKMSKAVAINKD